MQSNNDKTGYLYGTNYIINAILNTCNYSNNMFANFNLFNLDH